MAAWGLLMLIVGILYGALTPGRQDKGRLFRQGLTIGLVVGLVFLILALLIGGPVMPIVGVAGFLGILLDSILLALLFILGVWIGDLISGAKTRPH